ncbi:BRO-N domain-containing protein [Mesorhizobium sp. L-2-11]|uniref:BRO-N domain-containing protein n=1 Tax=Mesorhizobium sp. L-2-11 TaxID=2744521 RepID=UPI001927157C|nr:Bro-N domain-containing protein [Mesorhizobium sp. L-2-11]BCH20196.1 hypothetical protein MesoLjLa_70470 [Mesorhizobium sp. L-2-11]
MNALATFDFEDMPVRAVTINGDPWFVGKDVCRCLTISNANDAMARLNDDERQKGVGIADPLGKNPQEAVLINEPGVYRLIFESRKPEAERFRRWVFHEVLPSIRKTGEYQAKEEVDWDDVADKLHLVKETRLTHGRKAAQQMWQRLGLPDVADGQPAIAASDDGLLSYINDFIEECLEREAGAGAQANEVYRLYLAWATVNRAPHFTLTMFGRMVTKAGVRKRQGRHIYYDGLRIRHEKRVELRGAL